MRTRTPPTATARDLGAAFLAASLQSLLACAPTPPPAPPRPPVVAAPAPPAWPYWEAPVLDLHPSPATLATGGVELEPRAPAWLTADPTWRDASSGILASVREGAVAVCRARADGSSLGAFYRSRARRGAPLLITFDALFAVAHLAMSSVAADVEAREERPDLSSVLRRLDARLNAEVVRARPDLVEGYRIARTTVAVALALSEPGYVAPGDLAGTVSEEVALVRAHAGPERSPLFEVPFDYGAFGPRGSLSSLNDARAGAYLAAAWLGSAPFSFEGEGDGARINVGAARNQARGALLLSRLLVAGGDGAAAEAATRMERIDRFALGAADDLSPFDVVTLARRSGLDLTGGGDVVSPAKLDRFRHLASGRTQALGGDDGGAPGPPPWTALRSMRVVPLRTPADGRVLSGLVFPWVGPLDAASRGARALPAERRVPSALDIGAWLGSTAARDLLEERGDLRYAALGGTLSRLAAERPRDALGVHGSVYASMMEAVATWLRPSVDSQPPAALGPDARRKLAAALVAWTWLRHDSVAFAHELPRGRLRPAYAPPTPGKVFVERHPEAIAALLGALQQLRRGLEQLGVLPIGAPSASILSEAVSLLSLSLDAAVRAANGDRSLADLDARLAQVPARIAALEEAAGPSIDPVVIDVHVDAETGHVLEEATGSVEELWVMIRDPSSQLSVLAVGASVPHVELVRDGWARLDDASWRPLLASGGSPERDPWAPPVLPTD